MTRHRVQLRRIHGAPSWSIRNDVVEAWLTRDGGHLAPVFFKTRHGVIQPFSVAPWTPNQVASTAPSVLRNLRGDFFCLPFGSSSVWQGKKYSLHGETSWARWTLVDFEQRRGETELVTRMNTTERPGVVTKRIRVLAGHTVLYVSDQISCMSGAVCFGHHAMLRFPDRVGAASIKFSPIYTGQVRPLLLTEPPAGVNSILKPGAVFRDLRRVPLRMGGHADLTHYPILKGFDDLLQIANEPSVNPAWAAVTFPGERYLWFALKNPKQLASTILWYSNGGRMGPPWRGRHRPVLGIEDVTAYFDFGLASSARPNPLSKRGVQTFVQLKKKNRLRIPYIVGVASIPREFKAVRKVQIANDSVTFESDTGAKVVAPVDISFLSQC